VPAIVRLPDIELHECARELLQLPGSARLAGPQADDRVLHSHGLARLEQHIPNDAVALVEEAQHGNAIRHRRYAHGCRRPRRRLSLASLVRLLPSLFGAARATRREKKGESRAGDGELSHAQSGVQGW